MNFFEKRDQARKRSRIIVCFFALCVAATVASVCALTRGLLWWASLFPNREWLVTNRDKSVIAIGVLVAATILLAWFQKRRSTLQGGVLLATSLGAKVVEPATTNLEKKKLRNIVEEISLSSQVPVPEIFILDEASINAFAAGFSPSDAAITVTRGALDHLNREELQALVAHEFSHLLNGDSALKIQLISFVYGLSAVSSLGSFFLQTREGRGRRGENPLVFLGMALWLAGSIGAFFGRVLQLAVSREREYLADASAVQFTRQQDPLVSLLRKIGGQKGFGFRMVDDVHSHLFFSRPLSASENWFSGLFATHPPLKDRIRVFSPRFDDEWIPVQLSTPAVETATIEKAEKQSEAGRKLEALQRVATTACLSAQKATTQLSRSMSLQDPLDAIDTFKGIVSAASQGRPTEESPELLQILSPALRRIPEKVYDDLLAWTALQIREDHHFSFREFVLIRFLKNLRKKKNMSVSSTIYAAKKLQSDLEILFSFMAYLQLDEVKAQQVMDLVSRSMSLSISLRPSSDLNLKLLNEALDKIEMASVSLREKIVGCLYMIASFDNQTSEEERHLIKLINNTF